MSVACLVLVSGLLALTVGVLTGTRNRQLASAQPVVNGTYLAHSNEQSAVGSAQATSSSAFDCQPIKIFSQPPATFDPTTADNAELQAAGFPPRPSGDSNSPAVQMWLKAVKSANTYSAPNPAIGTVTHGTQYSTNWAGYCAPSSDFSGSPNFTFAMASWTQPAVTGDSNYSNYNTAPDSSFWVGTGVTQLIQAGVDSIATGTPQYRFWTEDYPAPTVWEGPVIHPGDGIFVDVIYEGNNEAYYFLENTTTGNYQSFINSAPYIAYRAANFINEQLGPYLPQFSSVPMTMNEFGNTSVNYFMSTSHSNKEINTSDGTSSGTIKSKPGSITDVVGDFSHYWYHK